MCSLQDVRYFEPVWYGDAVVKYRAHLVDDDCKRTYERAPAGEQYPKYPEDAILPFYLCYACGMWFDELEWVAREKIKAHIQSYQEIYEWITRRVREEIDRTKSKQ